MKATTMDMRSKIVLVAVLAVAIVIVGWYCWDSQWRISEPMFGIYLSKSNELIISDEDIMWYDGNSHEIKLTSEGARKIQSLEVGVYGEPFVTKINDEEIYNGSFWTPISSIPYHGIVIEIPFNTNTTTIKLEKGYPLEYFQGADPRGDPRIFDHFQKIGKLKQ